MVFIANEYIIMITIVNSAVVSVSVLKSPKVSMVDRMGVIEIVISLV